MRYVYTLFFSVELGLRFMAYGPRLFCGQDWAWAVLDVFIVISSWWEAFVDTWYALADGEASFESFIGLSGLKAFRIIRLTRIVKTVRLMRIFRFVLALRTLIHSILHTLRPGEDTSRDTSKRGSESERPEKHHLDPFRWRKSLFWALVLLGLIMYVRLGTLRTSL